MRFNPQYLFFAFFAFFLSLGSSCKVIFPSLMFQTTKKDITPDSLMQSNPDAFLIKPGDILDFQIYSNKGFRLVDFGLEAQNQQMQNVNQVEYIVLEDSTVVLPIVGAVKIAGYTRLEAINRLESIYTSYINEPLVFLKITNWRVYVFSGVGEAKVVSIEDQHTHLLQILAQFGGVPRNSKAYKIKIIRGSLKDPVVKVIDVSKLSSLRLYDLNIQTNDIIYMDPVLRFSTGILQELTPILNLITAGVVIYSMVNQ